MSGLLATVEGALLRVTVNRPEKRNPLSRAVLASAAQTAATHLRRDRERRAFSSTHRPDQCPNR